MPLSSRLPGSPEVARAMHESRVNLTRPPRPRQPAAARFHRRNH